MCDNPDCVWKKIEDNKQRWDHSAEYSKLMGRLEVEKAEHKETLERAEKAEAGQLTLIVEMNKLRASIDDNLNCAVAQMTGALTFERDEARARHAEAVALLRECYSSVHHVMGRQTREDRAPYHDLIVRIDTHLAACDGKGKEAESDSTATRKCPACGEPVLHKYSSSFGAWIPIQYHDCKTTPKETYIVDDKPEKP